MQKNTNCKPNVKLVRTVLTMSQYNQVWFLLLTFWVTGLNNLSWKVLMTI